MNTSSDEAQLIERYFQPLGARREDVVLGIGDDAAVLQVPAGYELLLTTDALVQDVHFLPDAPAHSLGHRALAVNLSDIAAMGASPSWMLLSLVMPAADEGWLEQFSAGLAALALQHNVALVGGNLSRGPLSINVQLAGLVPTGRALRRTGGRAGDVLYVSGTVGDAAAGRQSTRETAAPCLRQRFEYPQPRVALGQALRGLAHACIDVSDGLQVDAERLAQASSCAVCIDAACLPLSASLCAQYGAEALRLALAGGEDYELCFSAAPESAAAIDELAQRLQLPISRIGALLPGTGVDVTSLPAGISAPSVAGGFDHFRH